MYAPNLAQNKRLQTILASSLCSYSQDKPWRYLNIEVFSDQRLVRLHLIDSSGKMILAYSIDNEGNYERNYIAI